ncbi:MAG: 50S ribosomal protein L10 [Spirochaetales bacterium]|uniref:Large ribosomal subunit protein uL10 n=1 Tax=Candidatus Thalassospirochaeta sargassi TaxID=3119039 RepID=A0AAJ1IHR1_9SPIO|nr:50S ribosomal protein L10 [Spirochaetales bacterium]
MSDYTVKIQPEKVEAINALKADFEGVDNFIFTDYRGLTVEQITELRSKLRETGASYKVVKNRFAKIALEELEKPEVGDMLVGPTAVVISGEEAGAAAKELFAFAKDAPVEIKGGIIGGDVFDNKEMEAYSKLPSKTELIAKLMGTMNAPVQNLVYILNAVPEKFVRTLKAYADSKED